MPKLNLSNFVLDYHRNGIAGDGFHVCLFTWKEDRATTRQMMAIVFDTPGCCAVLDMGEIMRGNIEFAGGNSWRGDHFEPYLREIITGQR